MPATEGDVWGRVNVFSPLLARPAFTDRNPDVFAVIERVSGYVGEAQPGSAAFKFGQSYGGLRMALVAAGIPFEEVTPQVWQRKMGVTPRRKDESKTAWKNRLKAKAQQLYPGVKVTLATADALLLVEYCRRRQEGRL